jgi:drug/metabolite transporter (DMT)-like permease
MSKSALGTASGLAAAGIWGGMYVVSKVLLDIIPPFTLIACRLLLGSLTLAAVMAWRHRTLHWGTHLWQIFGVGIIGYGISLGFQFVGTKLSTAANGSLVTCATPMFVLPIAWVILHERITAARLVALIISTIGVIAVLNPRDVGLNAQLFWGNVALLAAALTWALYSVLVRFVSRDADILTVSLVAFLGGLPIAIPVAVHELLTVGIGRVDFGVILGLLFLGVIATALAMFLWNHAFALVEASRASLTFFAQPVVGTLLGWHFLHETISPLFLLGGLLIAAGLFIVSRGSSP